jgi:hypothetical protein
VLINCNYDCQDGKMPNHNVPLKAWQAEKESCIRKYFL